MNKIILFISGGLTFFLATFKIAMPYLFDWSDMMDSSAMNMLNRSSRSFRVMLLPSSAYVLGKIGDERAIEPLTAVCKGRDINPYVRAAAIRVLGKLGHARAVETLILALEEDNDFEVQIAAAQALGKIGDERAIQPLAGLRDMESKQGGAYTTEAYAAAVAALHEITAK